MTTNLKTHRRVWAGEHPDQKYRQSMALPSCQLSIKEVRNSLETPFTFLEESPFKQPEEVSSTLQPLKKFTPKKTYQINSSSPSSLLTRMSSLNSKINEAQSLLNRRIVRDPTKVFTMQDIPSVDCEGKINSYILKRQNTSLSTMNLQSQKQLSPFRCRQKMTWAANLKQYYIGQIAKGVNGLNDKAYQHLYQSHHYLSSQQIQLPKVYSSVNLPCDSSDQTKKVLVLDMDETLIHCHSDSNIPSEIQVQIQQGQKGFVAIRPFALSFLKRMSKYFQIIVFTASQKCYADSILDQLDPDGLIKHRLYRENCLKLEHNFYAKDLRVINRDISQIILVDNSAISFLCQPENGVPILPYYGGADQQLLELEKYLMQILKEEDIRVLNRKIFKLKQYKQFEDCEDLVSSLYGSEQDYN